MENETEVKLTARQQFVIDLKNRIKGWLEGDKISTTFTTCSCAPSFGWSVEEYALMPVVANELRQEGYVVTSSVNHGVTDWIIINK